MLEILFPDCDIESFEVLEQKLTLKASSRKTEDRCSGCKEKSDKVHSYYQRYPHDLPLANYAIQLCLRVKRFYCYNSSCEKKTFAESFEPWLARYAHRSQRLNIRHDDIAIVLSASAGENLSKKMQVAISHDTLINSIHSKKIPLDETPRVLGVDDFAIRKGHSYGTLLLDIEKHKVVDLLPSRDSTTVSDWLEQNPAIEIITRDRSQEYKKACDKAAPQAVQVADRWHLLKNLSDHLTQWFEHHKHYLVTENTSPKVKTSYEKVLVTRENRLKKNLELYKKAQRLIGKGLSQRATARKLGMTKSTLSRWLKEGLPDKKYASALDPYLSYLKERWDAGHRKPQQLYLEILNQGFKGKRKLVENHLVALNAGFNSSEKDDAISNNRLRSYSPKEASCLFTRSKKLLSKAAQKQLTRLLDTLKIAKPCYDLVQRFIDLFHMKNEEQQVIVQTFCKWLEDAQKSNVPELVSFSKSLSYDQNAIEAALTLPWSNGQTEGKITKLKFIKRQMYGRASFALLRKKVLLAT